MVKGEFRLVDEGIIKEILRKKQLMEKDPNYHLHYSNGKKKSMKKEADKHSVSLELEMYDTKTAYGRKRKSRENIRCRRNLSNAMDWGLSHYSGELSQDFIKQMGYLIEPNLNSEGYRSNKVRIVGAAWSPPSPEKIEREIGIFLLENSCLDNVIEKAVHNHFHLARVHPFNDGNGRTARAIQNIVLEHSGFFPMVIKPSEKIDYLHLLDSAVGSYKVAEGNLTLKDSNKLNRIYESFNNPPLTEKEEQYRKSLVLDIMGARMAVEQRTFYNFMVLKLRDVLVNESERLYKESRKSKK